MAKGRHRKKTGILAGGTSKAVLAVIIIVLLVLGGMQLKKLSSDDSKAPEQNGTSVSDSVDKDNSEGQPDKDSNSNGDDEKGNSENSGDTDADGTDTEKGDAEGTEGEGSDSDNPDDQGGEKGESNSDDSNITNVDGNPALVTGLTEEQKDPNAPATGDNHTLAGIPEVIDYRLYDDGNILMVVNKQHAVVKDYKPSDLVTIDSSYGTWDNMLIKSEAYEAFKKMNSDAVAKGYNLKICSAYRSYDTQVGLFNNSLTNRGWETTYSRSAYPGRSEHHTGYAIDITSASMGWGLTQDFADYADGKWLNEHCQDYGFIVRYPKNKTDITGYAYEPWHFRYVGVDVAKEIMNRGITLEEYTGN